jgi:GNAT superfamily N-acetyltransferase
VARDVLDVTQSRKISISKPSLMITPLPDLPPQGGKGLVRIRTATPGDSPFIERVHRDAIRGAAGGPYSRAELESWASGLYPERYRQAMDELGERVLLAEAPPRGAVGFCSWRGGEMIGLYVVPRFTRRGIARRLLGMAEAAIAAAGHDHVALGASLSALPFYERCGYRVIRRRDWQTRGAWYCRLPIWLSHWRFRPFALDHRLAAARGRMSRLYRLVSFTTALPAHSPGRRSHDRAGCPGPTGPAPLIIHQEAYRSCPCSAPSALPSPHWVSPPPSLALDCLAR